MSENDKKVYFMMALSEKVKLKLEEIYQTNIQEILRTIAGEKLAEKEGVDSS